MEDSEASEVRVHETETNRLIFTGLCSMIIRQPDRPRLASPQLKTLHD
ncbi:hypothetical protein CFBP3846_P500038 (plasmid) [Pseudomonas syringae pv. avii]|uniref:Uncharacterized protein n=1 Tax=Pseudomonas syringae pv. avii TaxID=663959 RepID=A0ABY1UG61_PSESX|nr:hypothetical protein CFBP3846_P500038 [Pseudomonas syringae pv. avii]